MDDNITDRKRDNMNLLIEYPKCTTCKKAKQFLQNHDITFTERNIVEENPTIQELKNWIEQSGCEVKKFFNTSGLKYKALNLKDKLPTMTKEEQIALLATDGMLVKRPLWIHDKKVVIGFKEKEWETIVSNLQK